MRSLSIVVTIMIALFLNGCTHTESLGPKRTRICTVGMSSSLDYMDNAFKNKIVVDSDELGNAFFSALEEPGIEIAHLSRSEQKEVLGALQNSLEMGVASAKEKTDVQKALGHLRKQNGIYGWPIEIALQFHASQTGKMWNTSFEVCRMKPKEFRKSSETNTDPCYKKTVMFLNNASVLQLMDCLNLVTLPIKNVKATASSAQATVSFSAQLPEVGSATTGYTVISNPAGGTDVNAGSASTTHTVTGLKNGDAYTFTVKASNAAGIGLMSLPSNSVTPIGVPEAPVGVTVTAGNTRAKVVFSAPVSDGGSVITGYTVTSDPPGGIDLNAGTIERSHTITGLKNGTEYAFSVQATNALGTGPAASSSGKSMPFLAPGAPVNVTAIAGNTKAKISFLEPLSDGGSAITGYTVTSDPLGGTDINAGSTALTHTVTGLKNDTDYTFTVKASKPAGIGPASSPSNSIVPTDVPDAPTNVTAKAGNMQANVDFSAPVFDGGSAITGYTVASNPAGGTDSNAGTPVTTHIVTGLKNGIAYTFTVQATNVAKTSQESAPSKSVTPAAVPGVPSKVTASAGNAQAKVSFSAPAADGGSAVTGYTVTSNPPGGKDSNAGSSMMTHTVTGLKNGTEYTFTVQAANVAGLSNASSPSNGVTPLHVPDSPTNVTARAGNAQARVRFSAPASDGGSAITGYTVTSNPPGGTDDNAGSTALTHTIIGLKNGSVYTFTVQATNAVGTSSVSSPSNSMTPADVPGAPTSVVASAGKGQASVTFSAPAPDGGSAITGYTVTSKPAGGIDADAGSTALTHTINGLKNGTAYTFSVQAAKGSETGPVSDQSNSVIPIDVPGAPTNVTAHSTINAQAVVSFTEAVSDGGSAITGYRVSSNPPGGKDVNSGSMVTTHTIVGLVNGTTYTFSVQAENAAGLGPASSPSNSVIPAHPVKTDRRNSTR